MKHQFDFLAHSQDNLPGHKKFFIEVRTQIILCYLGLLAILMGISIPTVQKVVFKQIDRNLQEEIASEIAEFEQDFDLNKSQNLTQLQQALIAYLREDLVEEDQYFIFILKQSFFQSSPLLSDLPQSLQPNSLFIQQLIAKEKPNLGEFLSQDSQVGKIIYITKTFKITGQDEGIFIVARATGSEYQKAALAMRLIVVITTTLFFLTSIGVWFISGQILKPLRIMSSTARQISEKDLSQRLPVWGKGEMAEIALTFNGMMERLQNAFLNQKNFVSNASHELKTPITIIQGHLELMDDRPEEQQETITIIYEELDRMNKLVQDLLTLSKIEQPNFLHPQFIDIQAFTRELLQQANNLIEANLQLEAIGEGTLYIDPQRLTQAMMNLIKNAVQHTPSGEQIFIGSAGDNSEIRFWVKDKGKGINHSDQKQIFNPFARATNSYRYSDGSGLGLSIAQAIVVASGGSIMLDSLPGKGSTFTLIFPVIKGKRE